MNLFNTFYNRFARRCRSLGNMFYNLLEFLFNMVYNRFGILEFFAFGEFKLVLTERTVCWRRSDECYRSRPSIRDTVRKQRVALGACSRKFRAVLALLELECC